MTDSKDKPAGEKERGEPKWLAEVTEVVVFGGGVRVPVTLPSCHRPGRCCCESHPDSSELPA